MELVKKTVNFKDIPDEQIKYVKVPTLIIIIIIEDKDMIPPEHAIELHRLIDNSEIATIPDGQGGIH